MPPGELAALGVDTDEVERVVPVTEVRPQHVEEHHRRRAAGTASAVGDLGQQLDRVLLAPVGDRDRRPRPAAPRRASRRPAVDQLELDELLAVRRRGRRSSRSADGQAAARVPADDDGPAVDLRLGDARGSPRAPSRRRRGPARPRPAPRGRRRSTRALWSAGMRSIVRAASRQATARHLGPGVEVGRQPERGVLGGSGGHRREDLLGRAASRCGAAPRRAAAHRVERHRPRVTGPGQLRDRVRRTGTMRWVSASAYAMAGQTCERGDLAVDVARAGEGRHRALRRARSSASGSATEVAIVRSRRTSGCASSDDGSNELQSSASAGSSGAPSSRAWPADRTEDGVPRARPRPGGGWPGRRRPVPARGCRPGVGCRRAARTAGGPGSTRPPRRGAPTSRTRSGSRAGHRRAAPSTTPSHPPRRWPARRRHRRAPRARRDGRAASGPTGPTPAPRRTHRSSPRWRARAARRARASPRPARAAPPGRPASAGERRPPRRRRTAGRPRAAPPLRSATARRATPSSGNVRDPNSTCAFAGESLDESGEQRHAVGTRTGTSCTSSRTKQIGVGALAHATFTTHSTSSSTSARDRRLGAELREQPRRETRRRSRRQARAGGGRRRRSARAGSRAPPGRAGSSCRSPPPRRPR